MSCQALVQESSTAELPGCGVICSQRAIESLGKPPSPLSKFSKGSNSGADDLRVEPNVSLVRFAPDSFRVVFLPRCFRQILEFLPRLFCRADNMPRSVFSHSETPVQFHSYLFAIQC
jgi:hypothetical protein